MHSPHSPARSFVLLVLGALTAPALAQAPPLIDTLLVDLDPASTDPAPLGSFPVLLGADDQRSFFCAQTPQVGGELWVTDGTLPGTQLLTDLQPGAGSGVDSYRTGSFLEDGRFVFFGRQPGAGVEPFVTDGTPAGTHQIVDVYPGPQSSLSPDAMYSVAFEGRVYFCANDGVHGREIWSTDGTAAGTQLALDLAPGVLGGAASCTLFATPNHLIVAAASGTGPQFASTVYRWDGVGQAPVVLQGFGQFVPSDRTLSCLLGERLVFNVGSLQWWITDGTPAGTLKLFHSPAGVSGTGWCQASGDRLYLVGKPVVGGPYRLLVGSGVPGDLEQIQDWVPDLYLGTTNRWNRGLAVDQGLLCSAQVPGSGVEPVLCKGSSAASMVLAEIRPGAASSSPELFFELNGEALFLASGPGTGRELWRASFDPPGAALTGEWIAGPNDLILFNTSDLLLPTPNGVLFGGYSNNPAAPNIGVEPLIATSTGLEQFANLAPDTQPQDSAPAGFVRLGSRLVFAATEGSSGRELWSSDGTGPGTQLLADIDPGAAVSNPTSLVVAGERVLFTAYSKELGWELWATDGTQQGTGLVTDFNPGGESTVPRSLTPLGEQVLFFGSQTSTGQELYRLAPDGETIALVRDITPGTAGSVLQPSSEPPYAMAVLGGRVVFSARDGVHGRELWTSDGTLLGTSILMDVNPGPLNGVGAFITGPADRIFFVGETPETGAELWVTDGTPGGTLALVDLWPGPIKSDIRDLQAVSAGVVFTAETPESGRELYRSDGTAAGTQLVLELGPGTEDAGWAYPVGPRASTGGLAYLTRTPEDAPSELWVTDGTPEGTLHLDGGPAGVAPLQPNQFWPAGGGDRLMFSAFSATGEELWTTDGTPEGTFQVTDTMPGFLNSSPLPGAQLADALLFPATTFENGLELHSIPLLATGGYGDTDLGQGCSNSGPAPQLVALGALETGTAFALRVLEAAPQSTVLNYFSGGLAGLNPLGTCQVLLSGPALLGISVADAEGKALLPLAVPNNPAFAGLPLYFQSAGIEAGGAFLGLASLTQALELIAQ